MVKRPTWLCIKTNLVASSLTTVIIYTVVPCWSGPPYSGHWWWSQMLCLHVNKPLKSGHLHKVDTWNGSKSVQIREVPLYKNKECLLRQCLSTHVCMYAQCLFVTTAFLIISHSNRSSPYNCPLHFWILLLYYGLVWTVMSVTATYL